MEKHTGTRPVEAPQLKFGPILQSCIECMYIRSPSYHYYISCLHMTPFIKYAYTVLCTAKFNGHPLHVLAAVCMGEELDAACMQRLPAIIECPQVIYVCIYVDRVYVCISGPQAIDRSYIFFTYDPIHQVRIYCIVHSKWPSLTCTCACKLQLYVWARSWMQHACGAYPRCKNIRSLTKSSDQHVTC